MVGYSKFFAIAMLVLVSPLNGEATQQDPVAVEQQSKPQKPPAKKRWLKKRYIVAVLLLLVLCGAALSFNYQEFKDRESYAELSKKFDNYKKGTDAAMRKMIEVEAQFIAMHNELISKFVNNGQFGDGSLPEMLQPRVGLMYFQNNAQNSAPSGEEHHPQDYFGLGLRGD